MNEEIELHDSILKSLTREARHVTALLNAYIHRFESKQGIAPHTGWRQLICLEMDDAVILGSAPPSDAGISDGKVLIGSQTLDNSIPVSGAYEGPINVSLEFFEHEPISVQARRLKVLRLGTPEYVEDVNF